MGNIYITGDTHRSQNISKIERFNKPCDKLIICGDFGVPFVIDGYRVGDGDRWSIKDRKIADFYDNLPYQVLFVDGNHENHDYLLKQPEIEMFGGKVHQISKNIIHLMRGKLYTINGKTIWTFGGAKSIDKHMRIEGISWWSSEEATYAEQMRGLIALESVKNKVDYIITHTPSNNIIKELGFKDIGCSVANYMEHVEKEVKYRKWFCGHMHIDKYIKGHKVRLLYEDIIKLV